MKTPALTIIETAYGITFNPKLPYNEQLELLSPGGDLSNKRLTNEVLFKLCELVDRQQTQIDTLTKYVDSLGKNQNANSSLDVPHPVENPDPTKPLI